MLKTIVERMQLKIPPTVLRQMFNIIDVNHDGTLDLRELINGFQILFTKLLPLQVIRAVHVTEENQLVAILFTILTLLTFFGFVGIAFSSFVVGRVLLISIFCIFCISRGREYKILARPQSSLFSLSSVLFPSKPVLLRTVRRRPSECTHRCK